MGIYCFVLVLVWPILLARSIDTGMGNIFKGNFYYILFSKTFFGAHFEMMLFLRTADKRWNYGHFAKTDIRDSYCAL